jgi:D-alanyl-lipoteichoic acid acyltransferase DltB (MBOAT superfamily)
VRNLAIIMLLSGLWHGAGWNYLLWGVMQGLAMGVGYLWPFAMAAMGLAAWREKAWYASFLAVAITFAFWVFSLVAFRVTNTDDVWRFYETLFSLGWQDVIALAGRLSDQGGQLMSAFAGSDSFRLAAEFHSVLALFICFPIVFLAPNVFQFFGVTRNGRLGRASVSGRQALWVGLLAAFALAQVISGTANEFIYFAF